MKHCFILCSLLFCLNVQAQNESAFQFLQLPYSAHAAALGGDVITVTDDDPTLAFHNPALLTCSSANILHFGYMSYLEVTNRGTASYTLDTGARSAAEFGVEYLGFGNMRRTDAEGINLGTLSAKDMALTGIYCYDLSEYWTGGVAGKFIYSNYDVVYSLALGIDLGLNYYNPDNAFSFSILARQLGGQIKTYDGINERLPFNLVAGFSKELTHAPIRLSLTISQLNHWKSSDFYSYSDISLKDIFFRHFIIGADFFPTNNTFIAIGYNHLLHCDLSAMNSRSLAGFSIGGGLSVNRIRISASYGRYHIAANSLFMNIAYGL